MANGRFCLFAAIRNTTNTVCMYVCMYVQYINVCESIDSIYTS